jgi:predicted Rossmann fold flavoprotein
MAAVSSARAGARTVLLDRRRKIGAKILISGGTRCNVTNAEVRETDFNAPSMPFLRNVLRELTPDATRRFFEEHGVALKLEPTGKYFPVSNSARDVLAGLLRACDSAGVELRRETLVTGAAFLDGRFALETTGGRVAAASVVVCTGGLSYPETGSDGTGYDLARAFGHRIVRTSPALTPLLAESAPHASLSGVTVPATLTVRAASRVVAARTGALLFTHGGYSGPVALDISRHWIRRGWEAPDVELRASFVPDMSSDALETAWLAEARRSPRRKVASLLGAWMPNRLADLLAGDPELTLGRATREERRRVVAAATDAPLPVTDVAGYRKAEVTAGGVALDEVVARTLESKLRPGLFFAGEVLDVDGYIGGFNFQWAWSSGWVAGRAAARATEPRKE